MDTTGLVSILIGIWLLNSAIKNRKPLETAKRIVANPAAIRASLANAEGYLPTVTTAAPTMPTSTTTLPSTGGNNPPSTLTANGNAATAIAFARTKIGKPYVWGGDGTDNKAGGYDCSGLVKAAWTAAGYSKLPRTTAGMLADGRLKKVSRSNLIPGDLIFPFPGHVQLYAGNGRVIEAPGRGRNLREAPMTTVWTARRVPVNQGVTV